MTGAPFAHVSGIPIEETLGSFGPVLLVGFGVAWTQLHARLRRSGVTPHAAVARAERRLPQTDATESNNSA